MDYGDGRHVKMKVERDKTEKTDSLMCFTCSLLLLFSVVFWVFAFSVSLRIRFSFVIEVINQSFLAFFHRGLPPLRQFAPPEIWSENNRKISITKEICITIDFAP